MTNEPYEKAKSAKNTLYGQVLNGTDDIDPTVMTNAEIRQALATSKGERYKALLAEWNERKTRRVSATDDPWFGLLVEYIPRRIATMMAANKNLKDGVTFSTISLGVKRALSIEWESVRTAIDHLVDTGVLVRETKASKAARYKLAEA